MLKKNTLRVHDFFNIEVQRYGGHGGRLFFTFYQRIRMINEFLQKFIA
jgi:hypothetical protein